MRQVELLRCLVLAAQREGNLRLARELRGLTLTPSQAELLRVLADREPLTLTGLGELLICESGTNPSRLVDRLVLAGLVQRVTASGDRREVTLTLLRPGAPRNRACARSGRGSNRMDCALGNRGQCVEGSWSRQTVGMRPSASTQCRVRLCDRSDDESSLKDEGLAGARGIPSDHLGDTLQAIAHGVGVHEQLASGGFE